MRLCVCYKGTIQRPTLPGQGNTTAVSLGGHYKTLSVPRNPPFIGPCEQLGRICLALLLEGEGAARPRRGWGQHGLPTPRFLPCSGRRARGRKSLKQLKTEKKKIKSSAGLFFQRDFFFCKRKAKGKQKYHTAGMPSAGGLSAAAAAAAQLTSPGNLFLPSADCWKAGTQERGKERREPDPAISGRLLRRILLPVAFLRLPGCSGQQPVKSRTKQGTSPARLKKKLVYN